MNHFFNLLLVLLTISPTLYLHAQHKLYGMTATGGKYGAGVIYSLDSNGKNQEILHDFFQYEGKNPSFSTMCLAKNGNLYGVTREGGKDDAGVFFEFDPATGGYKKLLDLGGSDIGSKASGVLTLASNGKIYGVTNWGRSSGVGGIYEFDPSSATFTPKASFAADQFAVCNGGLVENQPGSFYGLCSRGGVEDRGVFFEYSLSANTLSAKQPLTNLTGFSPYGAFTRSLNDKFYALTTEGGSSGQGTLLEFDPMTQNLAVKINFNGTNGANPYGEMAEIKAGLFYGLTSKGGARNTGILFEYNASTNVLTKKVDFDWADKGANPMGSIMLAENGKLYAVTNNGGSLGAGLLFEYDPTSGIFTRKVDLNEPIHTEWPSLNGTYSYAALVQGTDGKLYGTTSTGGSNAGGVLFEFDPATGKYLKKLDFGNAPKGIMPGGNLYLAGNGLFYGVAMGGKFNQGVLFSFNPSTNMLENEYDFDYYHSGTYPVNSLLETSPGKLLGISLSTPTPGTIIYSFDIPTKTFTVLKQLTGTEGGHSTETGFIKASDGKYYCSFTAGGTYQAGTLLCFESSSNTATVLHHFEEGPLGASPGGQLTEVNGKLYGNCLREGVNANGTLFEYDLQAKAIKKVVDFEANKNGKVPLGAMTKTPKNTLLGVTDQGGVENAGVLFEFDPVTGTCLKKIDFYNYFNSSGASIAPALASNGKYYGMTSKYGSNNLGMAYEFDLENVGMKKLFDYVGANGGLSEYSSFVAGPPLVITSFVQGDRNSTGPSVFPNPCTQVIQLQPGAMQDNATVRLLDIFGRTLREFSLDREGMQVNVSALPAGTYIAEIANAKNIERIHFVKQ